MIQMADIREWRTHVILDSAGHKIGTLESVYVGTSTDEPAMATVRVAHDRSLVKHSHAIGTDDVLPAEDEEAVFRHYGLRYAPGAAGERQLARR